MAHKEQQEFCLDRQILDKDETQNHCHCKPTVADSEASPETAILSADAVESMDAAYSSEMRWDL